MSIFTDIAIPKTLADMCADRDRTLELITAAFATLCEATEIAKGVGLIDIPYNARPPRPNIDDVRQELDAEFWRVAFDKTNFLKYMDAEAKKDFFKDIQKAPAFTEDNVRTTFLSLAQTADAMFVRGMVNVLGKLSRNHKTNTNSPFKVNERAIISYMISPRFGGGLEINYRSSEYVNDIDRVFKVLDGKQHHPRALEIAANAALIKSEWYEDSMFQIKGFRNGNMHILFKRKDLLEKANKMIGEYYNGNALAKGRRAA